MKMKESALIKKVFDYKGAPFLAVTAGLLFLLENRYELRKRKLPLWIRLQTNTTIASTAALALRLVFIPAIVKIAALSKNKNFGLLRHIRLQGVVSQLIAFLLLDYGNYRWHKLNHSSPLLWRFHQVHHSDLDLDLSTAFRFHAGEVLASVIYRGAWVLVTGASPATVLLYEIVFEAATNFHHSNLRLPKRIDKALSGIIVTPRMHGIHHSVIRNETDSNFCIIFSLWDRLHKTLCLTIPQEKVEIGIPYVRKHLSALELLKMPLQETPDWKLPDGSVPNRY